jgi:ferredoxin/flavodoxin---NADP+ reductase
MDLSKYAEAEIIDRKDVAHDLWIVRLRTDPPLDFIPGQYATLGVRNGEKMVERAYSIASSPREGELEFFVELVPDGRMTPLLYDQKKGDKVFMRKAARGTFILDESRPNHLMVCTVTGVAPFVSMARTAAIDARNGIEPRVQLIILEGASRSWELAYDRELQELAAEASWLHYLPTVSRPAEDPDWSGITGRVHEHIERAIEQFALTPANSCAYLCGHPGMINTGKELLERFGFDKTNIREERYWVQRA